MKSNLPITAIILTYNEEKNIEDCLESINSWVDQIIIIDSFSNDATLGICKKYTEQIYKHEFQNYSVQRNWALKNTEIANDWIMNIDADHRISKELFAELSNIFSHEINTEINGFIASRKTIFMDRWIKYGGHYPVYHSFLFRNGFGYCEEKSYDQHFVVEGEVQKLKGDIIDVIADSLNNFISRHNRWSSLEANEQHKKCTNTNVIKPNLFGNSVEKRRFVKNVYNKVPIFLRSIAYFHYRYFVRLGFLDGVPGLIFHFLQGFWFRFLVDAKIYELRKNEKG